MDNMNNVIGEVGFRFSSRFSQLIGRNLISNPIVAVSELVKNSYDADADNISVEFSNLTAVRQRRQRLLLPHPLGTSDV